MGIDGSYDAALFDRHVTDVLENLPPGVVIRLQVRSVSPCWWFPAPFGPQHRVEIEGADGFTLQAWGEFLAGNPDPDGGVAA